ncbi:AsmA-like C-terminal region-containing protein, partial [Aurantibacter sp.]|uniref:AsmA family protein n=1 Tax=Aurantibacter sp. TaxID=2807103 RepID=UPI0035C84DE7
SIKNTTGKSEDTYVDVKTLNFKIDQDVFKSSAKITNLTGNTAVNAKVDGVLNLANLSKAYPVELENELTGLLKAKLNTAFDMNAIETNAYQRIKNNGTVSISDFKFSSKDIVNPLTISKANVSFNPGLIKLEQFNATSGKTDLNATGTINNLLGFLLSDKKLQGNFNVKSNTFAVSDFMVEGENASESSNNKGTNKESLKIPAFLDATINADAKTVYYDNLTLKDVKGELVVKDEKAQLNNVSSSVFNGKLALDGLVDTKSEIPTFNMNLNAKDFDISQSFNDLDLLKLLAPIAKLLQGKLNSTIALNGKLGSDFTPDLSTISGNALAELLTTEFTPKNEKVVSLLEDKLPFLDLSKLDLKDVVASLTFDNGKVSVKPIDLAYNDIKIQLGGNHNLQNQMDYEAILLVPAKYLGSDVNRLIGKINDPEVNNISIPVTANITGNLLKPDVKTDLSSGVKNLTSQLIEIQKQKLIGQGTDQIKDLLGNVLGEDTNDSANDTITNNSSSNPVKDVLGSVLGGNNSTPKDSTKPASNPVKDVLGGLFGKKKKKDAEN